MHTITRIRLRRALGLLVPPRSALRRRSDRIEVAARWVALVLTLLVGPVALWSGGEVTARSTPQVSVEHAERHQVSAEVLRAPAKGSVSARDVGTLHRGPARVRWVAADGTERVAAVHLAGGAEVGDHAPVWVDRADRPVPAPLDPTEPAVRGVYAALLLLAGDVLLALGAMAVVRRALDRGRLRAWELAWRRLSTPGTDTLR
jgi:hypothetical protein